MATSPNSSTAKKKAKPKTQTQLSIKISSGFLYGEIGKASIKIDMKMQGIQNSQNIGKEEKIWSAHISQFESYKGIIKTTKDWHKDKHMTNGTELKAQK